MKRDFKKITPSLITGIVLLLAIGLHILSRKLSERPHDPDSRRAEVGFMEELEVLTYDARVKMGASRINTSQFASNIATVLFDDVAIEQVNDGTLSLAYAPAQDPQSAMALYPRLWPWPRFIHGQIVRELAAQGAKAVGFDIMFPELAPSCNDENVPLADGRIVTSDQFFAEQMARAGNVYLAVEQEDTVPIPLFLTNAAGLASIVSKSDFSVLRRVKPFEIVRVWHPLIRGSVKMLQIDLRRATTGKNKIIIPKMDRASESAPAEIPLNANGTMKMTEDGYIDYSDDPDDQGSKTEYPYIDKFVWNLGVTLAAKALELDLEHPELENGKMTLRGPNGLVRTIPLDAAGYFYVDWSIRLDDLKTGRLPIYFGQLGELLYYDKGRTSGKTDLENHFKDCIVIVGSIASGNNVSDFGATPLESQAPLVTKHVNIANSILTDRFVERTSLPVEVFIIAGLGLVSGWLSWRTRVAVAALAVAGLSAGYVLFTIWMYLDHRYWIPMVMPVGGGLFLPHFSLVTYRVVCEQREQRRVRGIFSKIVSPDVVQELLSAEKLAALSGARRTITVFFADVRGFTEFTDSTQEAAEEYVQKNGLTAEQTSAYYDRIAAEQLATVNLYLATIADTIKKHRGTLDKYMGDCVMAFWGSPTPNDKHALDCVQAAIDAQRGLHALNDQRLAENERRKLANVARLNGAETPLPPLPMLSLGTGINTGSATVGLMGSDATILNYTVFGREVNLASRLEGASGRGRILISEATLAELQVHDAALAAKCIPLDPITPKGFRHPIPIYEVPWNEQVAPSDEVRPSNENATTTRADIVS